MEDDNADRRAVPKNQIYENAGGQAGIYCGRTGNPGKDYAATRHNAGFMALDHLAQRLNAKVNRAKFDALCGDAGIGGRAVLLMKPQTYMNASGIAISAAAEYYKIPPEHVIVLCDDITQALGKLRIRRSGSAGGHNGLKSIIGMLDSENFPRIALESEKNRLRSMILRHG